MRRILDRPSGPEFQDWQGRAAQARSELIASWRDAVRDGRVKSWKKKFKGDVWRACRAVFLDKAFHKKCAYCESKLVANDTPAVEHFRPKSEVTQDRENVSHPGYFWLAYEWWNLLLSCDHCNNWHTSTGEERHPGKLNEFPVGQARIAAPSANPGDWQEDLRAEDPILLNPYVDDPNDHIGFDPEFGVPFSWTDRGKATIETCDLGRSGLVEKRLDMTRFDLLQRALLMVQDRSQTIDSVVKPSDEMSMWSRQHIQWLLDHAKQRAKNSTDSVH